MNKKPEVTSRPRMYGKNTFVTNQFLAYAKAGKAAIYQHPDYICLSDKAYQNLLSQERHELNEKHAAELAAYKGAQMQMETVVKFERAREREKVIEKFTKYILDTCRVYPSDILKGKKDFLDQLLKEEDEMVK